MTDHRRIMIIVPNGATTDNRVVREAESLKRAGHDVLLVGLRLPDLPGMNAITPGGVMVRRVNWQYKAYSRIAMKYAMISIPVILLVAVIVLLFLSWMYGVLLAPFAAALLDMVAMAARGTIGLMTSSPEEIPLQSPMGIMQQGNPFLYHLLIIAVLLLIAAAILPFWKRFRRRTQRSMSRFSSRWGFGSIRSKVMHARNYGKRENVQSYSILEALLAPGSQWRGGLIEANARRHVQDSRTDAFVEIGEEYRPDIVQCHEIGSLPAGIALKKRLGCRVVYEAHEIYDDLANASGAQLKAHRRIHETCLPQVDGFVTVNEDIGAYYRATYPALPTPVILPNSVYPKRVSYDGRLHEAAGLPPEAKIMLYQGGFSPNRGLAVLLEAAFSLPENWYVVFMGKGPLEMDLKARAREFEDLKLEAIRGKLTMELRARRDDLAEPLSAAVPVTGDEQEAVLQRSPVVDLMLGRFLRAPAGEMRRDALEESVRSIRETELRLGVERRLRHELDQIRFNGGIRRARFIPPAPHSELVEWSTGAALGVIPYENVGLNHWYCSPNKIWEYANAGVPILASRLHYLNAVIGRWDLGWTFSSDPSVADIVSVMRSITEEDLAAKRKNCQRFIQADNYPIHEPRLLDLFAGLGASKPTSETKQPLQQRRGAALESVEQR
ncbi:glycosyltransferase (plasmid) [Limimaricola variabilis]|uniref:glycosyltransferase n=1 Tax=Limimaricola variabilis TaxID=1492771 RepID=UPI002AC918DB|nr:glycosyltransferase [Limimaricola variabilis]WPY97031.1 glycosyltransferase [Limimaricola variabilis]